MSKFLKRRGADGESRPVKLSAEAKRFAKEYPALHEFLTLEKWDDGAARKTGTLLWFFEDGSLKCCLSDRDAGFVCFITGCDPFSMIDSIELGLTEDSLDWRASRKKR